MERPIRHFARVKLAIYVLVSLLFASPALTADPPIELGDCTQATADWLLRDPYAAWGINDNLATFSKSDTYGIPPNSQDYSIRQFFVPFIKDKKSRKEMVRALLQDLRIISDQIKLRVADATKRGQIDMDAQVYDIITLGAGPQGVVFDYNLARANPNLKTLTIEASSSVANTFNTPGFRLNSLNRPGTINQISQRGVGNQNALAGLPVQITDFSAAGYPDAQDLADVSTINRGILRESSIVFNTEAYTVEHRALLPPEDTVGWPTDFRITTSAGYFYTDHLVVSSGLGRELDLSAFDEATRSFYREERKRALRDPSQASVFDSATGYFRYKNTNGKAFEEYANQDILVIGAGDSGNTVIEDFLGFGPEDSYGQSTAQTGRPRSITWSGQSKTTCEELLNSLRSRYSGPIIGGVKSEVLKPVTKKAISVTRLPSGKLQVKFNDDSVQEFDRVIVATGFQDGNPELLSNLTPKDLRGRAFGTLNSYRESDVLKPFSNPRRGSTLGKRLVCSAAGPLYGKDLNIYFTAPAAGRLVTDADLRGVDANVVSLFNNAPRTQDLAKYLGGVIQPKAPKSPTTRKPRFTIETSKGDPSDVRDYRLDYKQRTLNKPPAALIETSLKSQLAAIFQNIRVVPGSLPSDQLRVRFFKGTASGFLIRVEPGLSFEDEYDLLTSIRMSPELLEELSKILSKNSRNFQIADFKLEFTPKKPTQGNTDPGLGLTQIELNYRSAATDKKSSPFGTPSKNTVSFKARTVAPVIDRPKPVISPLRFETPTIVSTATELDQRAELIINDEGYFIVKDSDSNWVLYSPEGQKMTVLALESSRSLSTTFSTLALQDGTFVIANGSELVSIDPKKPSDIRRIKNTFNFKRNPPLFFGVKTNTTSFKFLAPEINFNGDIVRETLTVFPNDSEVLATNKAGAILIYEGNPPRLSNAINPGTARYAKSKFVFTKSDLALVSGTNYPRNEAVIAQIRKQPETDVQGESVTSIPGYSLEGSLPTQIGRSTVVFPGKPGLAFSDLEGRFIRTAEPRGNESFLGKSARILFPTDSIAVFSESGKLFFGSANRGISKAVEIPGVKWIESSLVALKNGQVALAGDDQIIRFYRADSTFERLPSEKVIPEFTLNLKSLLKKDAIRSIVEQPDGSLVILAGNKLYRVQKK